MARNSGDLLELDIDKLFEERSIDEIIEIEKLLDAEIERKRNELRSMVGDRYKDILAASDAIKYMKTISKNIVDNIESIMNICEDITVKPANLETKQSFELEKQKLDERILVIQIRLSIFINEQIWMALDKENNLDAAQYYLLAQHIHTGLSLTKKKRLDRIPLLNHIKSNLSVLRSIIFEKITSKLESVEITAEETSRNLNALILLENQSSKDLLSIFVEHRKTALNTVINNEYTSVRVQISSMVRCLITTVHLLHDCFINKEKGERGLIWQQLLDVISESSPTTLSKLKIPVTPLSDYIPEIVKQFRPRCKVLESFDSYLLETKSVLENWLESTRETVGKGLEKSLKLITNVWGLHLTREESLKIEPPKNWNQICSESHLPDNFDVWYHFIQSLITDRCRALISKQVETNVRELEDFLVEVLKIAVDSDKSELDLRWYAWNEEVADVSKTQNSHKGLSMKTLGFSPSIVKLCERMDAKYLDLLRDVSQYFYGQDYNPDINLSLVLKDFKFKRKFSDRILLEDHLRTECTNKSLELTNFILTRLQNDSNNKVLNSIVCARFLSAVSQFCPSFNRCCTLNSANDDWSKVCETFKETCDNLWENWIEKVVEKTNEYVENLDDVAPSNLMRILPKWDKIEIQEQTDEKVFKSQIKVPLKPSLVLNEALFSIDDGLNRVLPHTLPKSVHLRLIERNLKVILAKYAKLADKEVNQTQALQFLFDVRFLTTFCVPRENKQLNSLSQEICDKFRSKIDPFDLDVFYSYLQNNVKRAVVQSQMYLGCLLPSSVQLASLGMSEKSKEQEKIPSILSLSVPSTSSWFPLLPITVPSQKIAGASSPLKKESSQRPVKVTPKRSGAASLFGGLGVTTDWFS